MTESLADRTRELLEHAKLANLARVLSAHAENPNDAAGHFARRWPNSLHRELVAQHALNQLVAPVEKGAVTAPTFTQAVTPPDLARAFVPYAHPFTILGRLVGLRRSPFNSKTATTTTPATFSWAGEGKPAPLAKLVMDDDTLAGLKGIIQAAVTRDQIRLNGPASEQFVLEELRRSYVAGLDDAFVNPANTAVAGVRPASITAAVTPITSVGNAVSDVRHLLQTFEGKLETATFILSSANAVALRLTGNDAFRELTREGGRLAGAPALCSAAAGNQLILADANSILIADDGEIDFSIAPHATVEMLDGALQQDATSGTGAQMVSLWQSGLVGIRCERFINWVARDGAVAVVDEFDYVNTGSPA